jgi:hypothetical protein
MMCTLAVYSVVQVISAITPLEAFTCQALPETPTVAVQSLLLQCGSLPRRGSW